jgi:hypothetical protein
MGYEIGGEKIKFGPRESILNRVEREAFEAGTKAIEEGRGIDNPYREGTEEYDYWQAEYSRVTKTRPSGK